MANKLRELHNLSDRHRHLLQPVNSCFYCLQYSKLEEIEEWIDCNETALCPKCGIDSVLPGIVDCATLEEMNEFWFWRDYNG